ncbi:MAG: low molecular weight phosphotyrosine protein phosphatase [Clostridia bacterium]|nr:low molecular weight phosphotyrosine protein phosphatase [Clostridia bacterium]
MIRVMFVCLGNICRSPMAEFIFRSKVEAAGLSDKIEVASSGTSDEEEGNRVHRGTARVLDRLGIDYSGKRAVQITASDRDKYDYFIAMDSSNVRALNNIGIRSVKLLSFCGDNRDVADPWYTGNFDKTYEDVDLGTDALLAYIISRHSLTACQAADR